VYTRLAESLEIVIRENFEAEDFKTFFDYFSEFGGEFNSKRRYVRQGAFHRVTYNIASDQKNYLNMKVRVGRVIENLATILIDHFASPKMSIGIMGIN
jgi:hypothetical protein